MGEETAMIGACPARHFPQDSKKGTGFNPVPFINFARVPLSSSALYVVPGGTSRGDVRLLTTAWKICASDL